MYQLIFENSDFIIVDKAANVLSVPSRMGIKDERPCLGIQLQTDFKLQIMPVHRLDFEVSGLVLFAKNTNAQRVANAWFENKIIQKSYIAKTFPLDTTTETFPKNELLKWECILAKGKKRAYEAAFGKKAITEAILISIDENNIHQWILSPITGRSHQLRFELFRHGHPILGDALYQSQKMFETGIALRSFQIDFSKCPEREKFSIPEIIKINGF